MATRGKQLAVSMQHEEFGQSQGSWSVEDGAIMQFMMARVWSLLAVTMIKKLNDAEFQMVKPYVRLKTPNSIITSLIQNFSLYQSISVKHCHKQVCFTISVNKGSGISWKWVVFKFYENLAGLLWYHRTHWTKAVKLITKWLDSYLVIFELNKFTEVQSELFLKQNDGNSGDFFWGKQSKL